MAIFNAGGGGKTAYKSTSDSNFQLNTLYIDGQYTYPTEDSEGNALSTTFTPTKSACTPFRLYRRVVIPEYFTTASALPDLHVTDAEHEYMVRELRCEAVNASLPNYVDRTDVIDRLEYPLWQASSVELHFGKGGIYPARTRPMALIMPKVQKFYAALGQSGALLELSELDLSEATDVGGNNNNKEFFQYVKSGNWIFPACTQIAIVQQPEETQTMRFPSVTTIGSQYAFEAGHGSAKLVICFGPNLATFNSTASAAMKSAGITNFELHIPEGNTTTYNTLVSAGFTEGTNFIRDYGTADCYPEDAQYFS